MESPANLSASRTAHPSSPADSTATHPFQAGEEARDFFYAEVEDNEPVPQLSATAAARTAVRSRPPLIKPTPTLESLMPSNVTRLLRVAVQRRWHQPERSVC